MSTLDDLRNTLAEHAEGLDDTGLGARGAAVGGRVRVVRRRRRAAAGAALALVLVAGGSAGLGSGLGHPRGDPAGTVHTAVLGLDVPAHVMVTGYAYDYEQGYDLALRPQGSDRVASLTIPATDRQQAVSLTATGLGDGSATLSVKSAAGVETPVARVIGDGSVEAAYPLDLTTADLHVVVRGAPASARVGLVLYQADVDLPPGVSNGTQVFRAQVADRSLVTAGFAKPGAASVTLSFDGRLSQLRLADYCLTTGTGLWSQVEVDGQVISSRGCAGNQPDAGAIAEPIDVVNLARGRNLAGEHHTARISWHDGPTGPVVVPPAGSVLGLGVYTFGAPQREVIGAPVDAVIESDGRVWVIDRVLGGAPLGTAPQHLVVDTSDGDRLVELEGGSRSGDGITGSYSGRLDKGLDVGVGISRSTDPTLSVAGELLDPFLKGDTYTFDVGATDPGDPYRAALVVYRPLP